MNKLELKIPPLVITAIISFFMWFIPNQYEIRLPFQWIVSGFLFIAGSAVALLAVLRFIKQKTTVDPRNPQKSNELVVEGIYKYTRNPMYLGFLLWLLSLACFLGNPWSILLIAVYVIYLNTFQIIPEERLLLEKFGNDYLFYQKSVRRWI